LNAQSTDQIQNNRLRVKTSIDVVRWLAFQGCAFRGYDETSNLKNRGNFLEMIKFFLHHIMIKLQRLFWKMLLNLQSILHIQFKMRF